MAKTQNAKNPTKAQLQEENAAMRAKIDQLKARIGELESSTPKGDAWRIPAKPLPNVYHRILPKQVILSLRPSVRRKFVALRDHLHKSGAVIGDCTAGDVATRPVVDDAHVLTWILEQVKLDGE